MKFEKDIWQAAWDIYRINWKTVLAAVAAALILDLITDSLAANSSVRFIPDIMIWSMAAISMHGTILLNRVNLGGTDSKLLMPFVWRSLAILSLPLVPTLAAIVYFYEPGEKLVTILKALAVFGVSAWMMFALLGTWLPAIVAAGDKRIAAAFARGKRTFAYAASRLIAGPGIVQVVLVTIIFYFGMRGFIAGEIYGEAGLSTIDLIFWPLVYLVRAYSVTILSVVLSRAYLMAEQTTGRTPPSSEPNRPSPDRPEIINPGNGYW